MRYDELSELEQKMGQQHDDVVAGLVKSAVSVKQKCPYDLPTIKRKNDLMKLFSEAE